jgi:hypothetical protein
MDILRNQSLIVSLLFVCLLVVTEGCTTRLGDFTVLSTKNVDVSGLKPGDRFSGEDCVNYALGMIPLGDINYKNAMDQALEKGKGDVMVDIVLTASQWAFPLIWGQVCVVVEGNVSQTASYKR